jgi:hypothetical protein
MPADDKEWRKKLTVIGVGAVFFGLWKSVFRLNRGEVALLINRFDRCTEKDSKQNVGRGHQTIARVVDSPGWHFHPPWQYPAKFDMLTRPQMTKLHVKFQGGKEAKIVIRSLARLDKTELLHIYKANRLYSLRKCKNWTYTISYWKYWSKACIKGPASALAKTLTADAFISDLKHHRKVLESKAKREAKSKGWKVILEDLCFTEVREIRRKE